MSKAAAGAAGGTETVKVMVRVRPMNSKEKTRGKFIRQITLGIFECLSTELQPWRNFVSSIYFPVTVICNLYVCVGCVPILKVDSRDNQITIVKPDEDSN